jgi:short-subunit dehydrogenase
MVYSMKDKVALVTGASQGLGMGLSYKLALEGAKVVGVARSEDKLANLQKRVEDEGGTFLYKALDLMKDRAPASLVDNMYKEHGGFEILINNAGMLEIDRLQNTDPNKLDDVFKLNAVIPMHLYRAWIAGYEHGKERKPEIGFNMNSISSLYSWGGGVAYQMSKTALSALHSALNAMQAEAADEPKIRYASIYPDSIDTGMITKQEVGSQRKLQGDFLRPEIVIDTVMKMLKEEDIYGKYDNIAILANPSGYERGVYAVFMPTDEETGRPVFGKNLLRDKANVLRIAGEEALVKR